MPFNKLKDLFNKLKDLFNKLKNLFNKLEKLHIYFVTNIQSMVYVMKLLNQMHFINVSYL